jgi:hypothetical protein
MSESIYDKTVGVNGSFEVTEKGLPVNWLVYTPKTIPKVDYDLILDSIDCIDGNQSLKFAIRDWSPTGGWHSPGLAQEYEATPGEQYNISFWAKNMGCEFLVKVGGVSAFEGENDIIVNSKEEISTWKYFEYQYAMPLEEEFDRIRFDLNIL